MKKKMLLLVSVGAMVLSAALLITPAKAFSRNCTTCTGLDSKGNTITATCEVRPIDACICPLTGTITNNGCLHFP